jgi:hypothetical protein
VTDDAPVIRARATAVAEAVTVLRSLSIEERADWLSDAAQSLAGSAYERRDELSEATGLSIPMVEWASRTTLGTISSTALLELAREAQLEVGRAPDPVAILSVILAGNVFTASVRGIIVPLLFGIPVLAKASSSETLFPMMLRDALRLNDSRLGAAMDLVSFPGGDIERGAALAELAEAVSVYGSDQTVASLATELEDTPLISHGHGVSVAYCGTHARDDARIANTIKGLSLDICAYDQRGCLSPQLVYVEEGPNRPAATFAERLAEEGLHPMSHTLPRGPLPMSVGAAQAQWRGTAEVEGTLLRGDSYAVAIRDPDPIRWSPGYRNVTVVPVRDLEEALRAMEAIGSHLKCIGVDAGSLPEVQARLAQSSTLDAYACGMGEMQTPSLNAPADGLPIWQGLFRHATPD